MRNYWGSPLARFALPTILLLNSIVIKVLLSLALFSWLSLYSAPGCSPHFTLSVGTMHTIYALPLRLAASADKPIFEENGLTVNIVYFQDHSEMERALLGGEIDAALDDLVSAVMLNKDPEQAKVVLTAMRASSGAEETLANPLVILFSQAAVKERVAAIIKFTGSYEQAMWELNRNAEPYRSLMADLAQSPTEVGGKLPTLLFPFPAEVPTESEVEAIGLWLGEQQRLSPPLPYRHVVDPRFLPPPGKFAPARCCTP